MEVDRVYILRQQSLSYCLPFVHSWMKLSVRCVLLCPNDPKAYGPFEFLQGLRAYCPNIFNVRWRILRLPAKLRPIILPFASTSLALVSSETV